MAINKLVTKAIKDSEIKTDNLAEDAVTTAKIGPSAVESSEINDGTVVAADLATTLDLSPKTVTLPSTAVNFDKEYFNIALLGFKMAVNESLTVFNLVDGIVDVEANLQEFSAHFSAPIDADQLTVRNFTLMHQGNAVQVRPGDPIARGDNRYAMAPLEGWKVP